MDRHRMIWAFLAVWACAALPSRADSASMQSLVAEVGGLEKPAKPVGMFAPAQGYGVEAAGFSGSVVADEFLSIVAEIAVDRARRQGLGIVKRRIENGLCTFELKASGWSTSHHLARTCELVRMTDLQTLVGQGKALRGALTSDVMAIAEMEVAAQMVDVPPLARTAHASIGLIRRLGDDPDTLLTRSDVWLVADAFVNGDWSGIREVDSKQLQILKVSIAATRVYLALLNDKTPPAKIDLAAIIREVIATHCADCGILEKPEYYQQLVNWSTLGVRAVSAMDGSREDYRERLRASLQLAFDAYARLKPGSQAGWGGRVVLAAFDADAPRLVASIADAFRATAESRCEGTCSKLRKYTALLTGISTYAITYQEEAADAATPDEIAALLREKRQARKEALESVIDAATVRDGRGGEYVMALGTGVGALLSGSQRIASSGASGSSTDDVAGQLHVPIGISFQRLPSNDTRWNAPRTYGLHGMVSLLDLGKYIADTDTEEDADWESVLSPGIQIGLILGRNPNSFFVLGYEYSKSPRFVTEETGGSRSSTRHGVVLHYYFSLFDLN